MTRLIVYFILTTIAVAGTALAQQVRLDGNPLIPSVNPPPTVWPTPRGRDLAFWTELETRETCEASDLKAAIADPRGRAECRAGDLECFMRRAQQAIEACLLVRDKLSVCAPLLGQTAYGDCKLQYDATFRSLGMVLAQQSGRDTLEEAETFMFLAEVAALVRADFPDLDHLLDNTAISLPDRNRIREAWAGMPQSLDPDLDLTPLKRNLARGNGLLSEHFAQEVARYASTIYGLQPDL